ncbi:hypothetical protein CIB48_g6254 [Xylaria polymorpha]|nr:hypothetical protein CIB48_g6254 [Xylaria polymorpha]
MSAILRFPYELCLQIASDKRLSRDDLAAMRLVCRLFASPAAEILFRRVKISRLKVDKDSLEHIAASEHLAQYVRELVWHELDLEAWVTLEEEALSLGIDHLPDGEFTSARKMMVLEVMKRAQSNVRTLSWQDENSHPENPGNRLLHKHIDAFRGLTTIDLSSTILSRKQRDGIVLCLKAAINLKHLSLCYERRAYYVNRISDVLIDSNGKPMRATPRDGCRVRTIQSPNDNDLTFQHFQDDRQKPYWSRGRFDPDGDLYYWPADESDGMEEYWDQSATRPFDRLFGTSKNVAIIPCDVFSEI